MGIQENYFGIKDKIDSLTKKYDRIDPPRLLAVSKRHSVEKVKLLYSLGQRGFGENYFNELIEKAESLKDLDINWSYIGPIQSKKIRKLVSVCQEIQTVSNSKHLRLIAEALMAHDRNSIDIFIQVNLGEEEQKSGVTVDGLEALKEEVADLEGISLQGVMIIPPKDISFGKDSSSQAFFARARELADGVGEGKLSLGMTHDLEMAIRFGSDCVRIGTAIFGERSQ